MKARYLMIGGFLGAGKTTLIGKLGRYLEAKGRRVGLITNDQSSGLVDTVLLRGQGFEVEEIAGGCFCCRFHSLDEAVHNLSAKDRPDDFLAEPVGSCTDLLATVSYPLRRIFGDEFVVAPLTVVVDPLRAARILGLGEGKSFSKKVVYVYEKQLEEARFILVNKIDLIDAEQREELVQALEKRYPRAEVLCISATEEEGLDAWFEMLLGDEIEAGPTLEIDYELYAEGEALLGWINATASVRGDKPFDANALVAGLSEEIRRGLEAAGHEIAHLKLTLDAQVEGGALAVISVVGSDREPDVREALFDAVDGGSLIINLRAEADPEELWERVEAALRNPGKWLNAEGSAGSEGLEIKLEHKEAFRPGAPVPVHRDRVLEKPGG